MTRILLAVIILFLGFQPIFSQDNEKNYSFDLGADLVSRYVWRGIHLSESPAIQPILGYTHGRFSLGSWASYTLSRENLQEVDLYLTYSTDWLSITLNNYFTTPDTIGFSGNYFNLGSNSTAHVFEGVVALTGTETFPVSLTIATMFYGNDRNEKGELFYSTYIEVAHSFSIKEVEALAFLGVTPANGLYADNFDVVNLGISATKKISVTETFQLPVTGSFVVNPSQEQVFFVFGITL